LEVDLHIHSAHSNDCRSRPEAIVKRALAMGLGAIAVTDHNSWEGARAVSRAADGALLVIPGAEMKTDKGDLLALFVEEEVRTRDWADAVDQIRSRGGLSIVPHPLDSPKLTKTDIVLADGLEVFNSTCRARSNTLSLNLATELKKPGFATSDAHRVSEIGNGRTSVPDCSSLDSLRKSIMTNPVVSWTIRSNRLAHRMNSLMVFGIKGMWRR